MSLVARRRCALAARHYAHGMRKSVMRSSWLVCAFAIAPMVGCGAAHTATFPAKFRSAYLASCRSLAGSRPTTREESFCGCAARHIEEHVPVAKVEAYERALDAARHIEGHASLAKVKAYERALANHAGHPSWLREAAAACVASRPS
jgi:hypothetical protein